MNEKQLKRLIAYTCIGFAFFCLLWLIFTYFLLPVLDGQKDYTLLVNDPEWIYTALVGLLSSVLGFFAVFGIYYANRDAGGIILFIGVILLVLGFAFEMASLTWDIFIWPVMCIYDKYYSFVSEGIFIKSLQFNIFIIALMLFLLTGNTLTAIGLLKTKRHGRIIPLLMIIGILLYGIGNVLIIHIAALGLLLYSISFVLIGLRLLKE